MARAMAKNKPIGLAVLRCDYHAYWFMSFLVRTDPLELRAGCPFVHRLQTDAEDPAKFVIKRVGGFKLINVWDANRGEAERFAASFKDRPRVCETPAQAIAGVDAVLIANCSFDGADHLALAAPALKAGLPTFIDKPFAGNFRDAKAIVRLANKHKAPLMAASLLHHAEQIDHFRRRKVEIGDARLGIVHGSHGWETPGGIEGVTHGIAIAQNAFDGEVVAVECIGALPRQFILLHYDDGKQVMVISPGQEYGSPLLSVEAWGDGHIRSAGMGDVEFLTAGTRMLRTFKQMVRTKQAPTDYENLLTWARIAEAALRAQHSGKRVTMKSVR